MAAGTAERGPCAGPDRRQGYRAPDGCRGCGPCQHRSSVAFGVIILSVYFHRLEHYVAIDRDQLRPRFDTWRRLLGLGLPSGGEFLLMFVIMAVVYGTDPRIRPRRPRPVRRRLRLMQAIFLPAMALAFAVAPWRGRISVRSATNGCARRSVPAAAMSSVLMLVLTIACQWQPAWHGRGPSRGSRRGGGGRRLPRDGLVEFRRLGHDLLAAPACSRRWATPWPSLVRSASRLVTFVLPAVWLLAPSRRRAAPLLVPVGRQRCAAGAHQPASARMVMRHDFRRLPEHASDGTLENHDPAPVPDDAAFMLELLNDLVHPQHRRPGRS